MKNYNIACIIDRVRSLYLYSFLKPEEILDISEWENNCYQITISYKTASKYIENLNNLCLEFKKIYDEKDYMGAEYKVYTNPAYKSVGVFLLTSINDKEWLCLYDGDTYLCSANDQMVELSKIKPREFIPKVAIHLEYAVMAGFLDDFIYRNIDYINQDSNNLNLIDLCNERFLFIGGFEKENLKSL